MIPFRVYDRDSKQMWIILNFHPEAEGSYMAAKEDDSGADGDMRIISVKDLATFKFVDFLDEGDGLDA